MKKFSELLVLFFLLASVATPLVYAAPLLECISQSTESLLKSDYQESWETLNKLLDFAKEHKLPIKSLLIGPPNRQIERVFVGVDSTNEELVNAYLKAFNLDQPLSDKVAGTLALEFQNEGTQYTSGVLRTSADPKGQIYRYGKPDMLRDAWWKSFILEYGRVHAGKILAFGHLIGLTATERENVWHFLKNPGDRGACKSSNCVAWTSSIELGKTAPGASDDERDYLFSNLGMARSMAHFEIARRLIRASNSRNSAIVAFYDGDEGRKAFDHLADHLPPDPKIPYWDVIEGYEVPQDSEVYKAISVIPDDGEGRRYGQGLPRPHVGERSQRKSTGKRDYRRQRQVRIGRAVFGRQSEEALP